MSMPAGQTTATNPTLPPASIMDIVSFGYKNAFRCVGPVTKLIWPVVLLHGLLLSFYHPAIVEFAEHGSFDSEKFLQLLGTGACLVINGLLLGYLQYVIVRFVRDLYWSTPKPSLWSYLKPEASLGGYVLFSLGLGVLTALAVSASGLLIFLGIVTIIGWIVTFPLTIAVWLFYCWYAIPRYQMVLAIYFGHQDKSFSENLGFAFTECANVLRGSFWRTFGLGLLVSVVYLALSLSFIFCNGLEGFLEKQNPSFLHSIWFTVSYGLTTSLATWFALIMHGGAFFVMYRYYYDIKIRRIAAAPVQMAEYQTRGGSDGMQQG